jgi:hypothetical protein
MKKAGISIDEKLNTENYLEIDKTGIHSFSNGIQSFIARDQIEYINIQTQIQSSEKFRILNVISIEDDNVSTSNSWAIDGMITNEQIENEFKTMNINVEIICYEPNGI